MLELFEIKVEKEEWGKYSPLRYEVKYKQMSTNMVKEINTNMGKKINGSKWRIQI